MSEDVPAAPPPKRKLNPYIIGFLIGAVVLTVLPFLQRGCLRAPPPLAKLGPWEGAEALRGHPWIASFVTADCDPACEANQVAFGKMLKHMEDLQQPVFLVTLVEGNAQIKTTGEPPRWQVMRVQRLPEAFTPAWEKFSPGADGGTFVDANALALVDQNGDVRGFWQSNEVGRGNIINAARMIAKYGPQP